MLDTASLNTKTLQGIGPMDGTVEGIPDRRISAMHTLYRDAEAGGKM